MRGERPTSAPSSGRPGGAEASRTGTSRFPWWGRRRIGLLLLGLLVRPGLPIPGRRGDVTPARRARGSATSRS